MKEERWGGGSGRGSLASYLGVYLCPRFQLDIFVTPLPPSPLLFSQRLSKLPVLATHPTQLTPFISTSLLFIFNRSDPIPQDITERKRGEAESARVARELRAFIDTSNAPIFGVDAARRINEYNNKAAEILGVAREEAMGKDPCEVCAR